MIILRSFITTLLFGSLLALNIYSGVEGGAIFDATEIIKALAISAFCYFGLFFFVKSLREEKVSIAVPVSSISGLFGVLFAVTMLAEKFSWAGGLSCVAFLSGVYLIDRKPDQKFRLSRGVYYNLAAAFFWGVGFALFVFPVRAIGVVFFSLILEATVCSCSMVLHRVQNKNWSFPLQQIDATIIFLAALGFGGVVFYNLSLLYLPVYLVSLLGALTPAVSIMISLVLLKERLNFNQYVGVAVILLGLIVLKVNW